MPTMQEIDEFVSRSWLRGQIAFEDGHMLDRIAEAARRGVAADSALNLPQLAMLVDINKREAEKQYERAEKAEAELAALKAAQPEVVEVIDPWVMDLVRKHGSEMTNSEIVQKFLPKRASGLQHWLDRAKA